MDFIDKIRKVIKMRHDDVVVAMTNGNVDNMEKYQLYVRSDTNISVSITGNIHPAKNKGAK